MKIKHECIIEDDKRPGLKTVGKATTQREGDGLTLRFNRNAFPRKVRVYAPEGFTFRGSPRSLKVFIGRTGFKQPYTMAFLEEDCRSYTVNFKHVPFQEGDTVILMPSFQGHAVKEGRRVRHDRYAPVTITPEPVRANQTTPTVQQPARIAPVVPQPARIAPATVSPAPVSPAPVTVPVATPVPPTAPVKAAGGISSDTLAFSAWLKIPVIGQDGVSRPASAYL